MRSSQSSNQRAASGELQTVDTAPDTASVEPFDDVREPDLPGQAAAGQRMNGAKDATGSNGSNGASGASGTIGANGISPPNSTRMSMSSPNDLSATHTTHTARHAAGSARASDQDRAEHPAPGPTVDVPHEPLSPDDPLAPLPFNPYKGNRGLTRAWHAMKNSLAGFRVAIREESAFRQELTLAAILIPCGLIVPVEPVSRVLLLGSVLLVLIVELLNSSVEAAIDRISLERHELSRRAKDLGSAAVMVALGMCVMTWAVIVGPLVVHWLREWL
ncbi:diacylglycerol kinase [Burkholderia sp. SRS-W-2-2016]|uniref:diacylglycerol kinase n=1 Tax=Burkholderia sp. SRS-W-2-2016 TaxID=1926878 RepID=UPI00094AB592|nr:diacylglycerol kinase [Burkholderia sp. SRS-W-2-2016]OLL32824.1 diacylglycerol kinase [Burkholderia sp. SRS-W-2-2016]